MRSSTKTVLSVAFASALLFGTAACSSDEEAKPATSASDTAAASEEPSESTDSSAAETTEEESDSTVAAGAPASLQEIVDLQNEAIQPQLESLKEIFSEVKVLAKEPNGVIYSYTYAIDVPAAETAEGIEAGEATLASTAEAIFPAMEAAGIDGPSVTFTYLNKDGSELWSKEYTN